MLPLAEFAALVLLLVGSASLGTSHPSVAGVNSLRSVLPTTSTTPTRFPRASKSHSAHGPASVSDHIPVISYDACSSGDEGIPEASLYPSPPEMIPEPGVYLTSPEAMPVPSLHLLQSEVTLEPSNGGDTTIMPRPMTSSKMNARRTANGQVQLMTSRTSRKPGLTTIIISVFVATCGGLGIAFTILSFLCSRKILYEENTSRKTECLCSVARLESLIIQRRDNGLISLEDASVLRAELERQRTEIGRRSTPWQSIWYPHKLHYALVRFHGAISTLRDDALRGANTIATVEIHSARPPAKLLRRNSQ